MRHRMFALTTLVAAALTIVASPARAEHEDDADAHRREQAGLTYALAPFDDWRVDSRRAHHDAHCRRVWIPGERRSVVRREWVRGHYADVVIPWKVEWTWAPRRRGHRTHLTVVTDNPYAEPARPDRRIYGPGHWERCVIQEYRVHRTWVPGHSQLVERTIETPGRHEMVCRRH